MTTSKCKLKDMDYESGAMVRNGKLCYKREAGGWEKKGAPALGGP